MNQPPHQTEDFRSSRSGKNYGFCGQTASWRRPDGVAEGTWDYVTDRSIADHYDAFVADTPLCGLDAAILRKIFPPQKKDLGQAPKSAHAPRNPTIFDFGCGTGRAAFPLANRGYRVVAIDLSQPMLEVVQQKWAQHRLADAPSNKIESREGGFGLARDQSEAGENNEARRLSPEDGKKVLNPQEPSNHLDTPEQNAKNAQHQAPVVSLETLRANLVQLDCIADHSADHGICLFSTIGMIQGRKNRNAFLQHAHRIIRPGGSFLVHVHHRWAALREYGGTSSLLKSLWASWHHEGNEFGDRTYRSRGLEKMFMHRFAKNEILSDLQATGWQIGEIWRISIDGSGEAHRFGIPGGYLIHATSKVT